MTFLSHLKIIVLPFGPYRVTVFSKQSNCALYVPIQSIPRMTSKSCNSKGIKFALISHPLMSTLIPLYK